MDRRRAFVSVIANQGVRTYTISGIVYDADGSTPVAGATIALGALSAISAANGTYMIENIPAGTNGFMTCTKTGYLWASIAVAEVNGNLIAQNYTNTWYAGGGNLAKVAAVFEPQGAASIAASLVNKNNPGTNDLTVDVALTALTSKGWMSQYAVSKLISNLRPANNWSVLTRVTRVRDGSDHAGIIGVGNGTNFWGFGGMRGGFSIGAYNGTSANLYSIATGLSSYDFSGVIGMAGVRCFLNGVYKGSVGGTPPAVTNADVGILTGNGTGTGANRCFADGGMGLLVFYDETISDAHMAIISAGMALYP